MARQEKVLSIFVASPSNVSEERDQVDSVVQDINSTHAKQMSVRFEVFRWERDIVPGFGENPQDVINAQLPPYDIFLGILWHTVGSPTKKAESGTVEEYERAKARYDQNSDSVRLMLYFKTSPPLSLENIDPQQFEKVSAFRKRIEKEGGLYQKFSTLDDFVQLLKLNLIQFAYDLQEDDEKEGEGSDEESNETKETKTSEVIEQNDDETADIEEGLFELEDRLEEEVGSLGEVLNGITKAMNEIAANISQRQEGLVAIQKEAEARNLSNKKRRELRTAMRRHLRGASVDMDEFATQTRTQLPSLQDHLKNFVDVSTKIIPIYLELDQDNAELKKEAVGMLQSMDQSLDGLGKFRNAMKSIPKVSTELIQSAREIEKVLQEAMDIMQKGKTSYALAVDLLP